MKLQIERPYFEAMVASFPGLASLNEQLRFGDRVEVAFSQLTDVELGFLRELYSQAGPDMQVRSAQIVTLQRAFSELKANAKGTITSTTLRISASDIVGKTVPEIFAAKGFLKETPELIAAYDDTESRYFAWRARYGHQFSGSGTGFFTEDPNSSHRDTDWSRKDVDVLSSGGGLG